MKVGIRIISPTPKVNIITKDAKVIINTHDTEYPKNTLPKFIKASFIDENIDANTPFFSTTEYGDQAKNKELLSDNKIINSHKKTIGIRIGYPISGLFDIYKSTTTITS